MRTFHIRLNGVYSGIKTATAESFKDQLPPLYSNLFVSDHPYPAAQGMNAQSADDILIMYQSYCPRIVNSQLKVHLDELESWCRKWRVTINPDKSSAVLFARRSLNFGVISAKFRSYKTKF